MYKFRDYLVTLADGRKLIEYASDKYNAKIRCLRRDGIGEEDIVSITTYQKESSAPPVPAERAREYIREAQAKLRRS